MRDDSERLRDMLDAIEKIESHVGEDRTAFEEDELLQVWVIYHLQIIGEAASRLSDEVWERHPEIPWKQIVGMRHILVHHYFGIDLELVWQVVENDLPDLKLKIKRILMS
ncbi:MAG: DUF86 domain-containing protein [Chloroflexi bacterium]|nr:DUF86 domain-containing protein [Chloroflexota bacterium]